MGSVGQSDVMSMCRIRSRRRAFTSEAELAVGTTARYPIRPNVGTNRVRCHLFPLRAHEYASKRNDRGRWNCVEMRIPPITRNCMTATTWSPPYSSSVLLRSATIAFPRRRHRPTQARSGFGNSVEHQRDSLSGSEGQSTGRKDRAAPSMPSNILP